MSGRPILEVLEEIEFRYPDDPRHSYRIPAGLRLFAGEVWCISGISGLGKTTLMTLLAALRRFRKGRIRYRFSGQPPIEVAATSWRRQVGPALWRRIGFAFQRPELIRSLTVQANLELVTGEKDAALFTADEWSRIARSSVWQISGGQTQRLGLLRAFGEGQDLAFLDEPTNNLDVRNRRGTIAFVQAQRAGRGMIVVSHDTDFLGGLGTDRVLRVVEKAAGEGQTVRTLESVPVEPGDHPVGEPSPVGPPNTQPPSPSNLQEEDLPHDLS